MQITSDPMLARQLCDEQRRQGRRVGFVPTMGYLHEGHLSLVARAREQSDFVVASIFVNPIQFGAGEDLERYPRDPDGDAAKCREAGVDLLLSPSVESIYPPDYQTYVDVEQISQGLCGARRPGHFRGVCTVVTKLFNIVGPCVAVFGEKDYQQLQVIRRMVADLLLPVEVVGSPIVREADGLAMSSRNAYLDVEQREAATCLHRALQAVAAQLAQQSTLSAEQAVAQARSIIEATPGTRIDYIELRQRQTLAPLRNVCVGEAVMLLAVFVGKTRLIDNMEL